jgi:hypothetical protein
VNYSPVQHHHTQSREFKSARLSQRGIWITLLQYCTSQENNGIIKNFASWKPAEIRKTLNVDPATLRKKSTLWNMVGEDLHIYGYPHDKQAILNKKRQTLANNTGVQPSPRPENNSSPPHPVKSENKTPPLAFWAFLRNTCVMDAWQSKDLNQKEYAAAMQAYQQTITCGDRDWQLLKAYYNGYYKRGQTRDSHNNKYYCPASRLKFYEDIIDVLTKAELWAKDTRWKPKNSPANEPPPQRNLAIPPPQETDVPVTPEELKQFFDEINPH